MIVTSETPESQNTCRFRKYVTKWKYCSSALSGSLPKRKGTQRLTISQLSVLAFATEGLLELVVCDDRRSTESSTLFDISRAEREAILQDIATRKVLNDYNFEKLLQSQHTKLLFLSAHPPADVSLWTEFLTRCRFNQLVLWPLEDHRMVSNLPLVQRVELSGTIFCTV